MVFDNTEELTTVDHDFGFTYRGGFTHDLSDRVGTTTMSLDEAQIVVKALLVLNYQLIKDKTINDVTTVEIQNAVFIMENKVRQILGTN